MSIPTHCSLCTSKLGEALVLQCNHDICVRCAAQLIDKDHSVICTICGNRTKVDETASERLSIIREESSKFSGNTHEDSSPPHSKPVRTEPASSPPKSGPLSPEQRRYPSILRAASPQRNSPSLMHPQEQRTQPCPYSSPLHSAPTHQRAPPQQYASRRQCVSPRQDASPRHSASSRQCAPSQQYTPPRQRTPSGQCASPRERAHPGQGVAPLERTPQRQGASPRERAHPGQGAAPRERTPPRQGASPRDRAPLGQGAAPGERSPHRQYLSPRERAPQRQGGSPRERPLPRQGASPRERSPQGQRASPRHDAPPWQCVSPRQRPPVRQCASPRQRPSTRQCASQRQSPPRRQDPSPRQQLPARQAASPRQSQRSRQCAAPRQCAQTRDTATSRSTSPRGCSATRRSAPRVAGNCTLSAPDVPATDVIADRSSRHQECDCPQPPGNSCESSGQCKRRTCGTCTKACECSRSSSENSKERAHTPARSKPVASPRKIEQVETRCRCAALECNFWCSECNELICSECAVANLAHKNHSILTAGKAATYVQSNVDVVMSRLKATTEQIGNDKQKLDAAERQVKSYVTTSQAKLRQAVVEAQDKLAQFETNLAKEIATIGQGASDAIRALRDETNMRTQRIDEVEGQLLHAVESLNDICILHRYAQAETFAADAQSYIREMESRCIPNVAFTSKPLILHCGEVVLGELPILHLHRSDTVQFGSQGASNVSGQRYGPCANLTNTVSHTEATNARPSGAGSMMSFGNPPMRNALGSNSHLGTKHSGGIAVVDRFANHTAERHQQSTSLERDRDEAQLHTVESRGRSSYPARLHGCSGNYDALRVWGSQPAQHGVDSHNAAQGAMQPSGFGAYNSPSHYGPIQFGDCQTSSPGKYIGGASSSVASCDAARRTQAVDEDYATTQQRDTYAPTSESVGGTARLRPPYRSCPQLSPCAEPTTLRAIDGGGSLAQKSQRRVSFADPAESVGSPAVDPTHAPAGDNYRSQEQLRYRTPPPRARACTHATLGGPPAYITHFQQSPVPEDPGDPRQTSSAPSPPLQSLNYGIRAEQHA